MAQPQEAAWAAQEAQFGDEGAMGVTVLSQWPKSTPNPAKPEGQNTSNHPSPNQPNPASWKQPAKGEHWQSTDQAFIQAVGENKGREKILFGLKKIC